MLSTAAIAQPCPKVNYTTEAATVRKLVAAVNCLVGSGTPKAASMSAPGVPMVDTFPVIGPQHTRTYRKIVVALLSVPTGEGVKTALVSAESTAASVTGNAGAECKIKLNPDNSIEGQCNQTGGTIYVVYQN